MSQGRSFRLPRAIELEINAFEYPRQVVVDLGIPKPENTIAFLFQPKLPLLIVARCSVFVVMPAVEFNDQPLGRTEKVHDIRTDGCLSSEMCSVDRKRLQGAPQHAFVRRGIRT